jgi:hypothetical protein
MHKELMNALRGQLFAPTGRTDPIGNLSCAIGEQTREPHLSRRVQRGRKLC